MRERLRSKDRARVCAFDIDNTLFDTRHRTLELARAFDRRHGTRHFSAMSLGRVGCDAGATCLAAGVTGRVQKLFEHEWLAGFWAPENFAFDRPIRGMIRWVRRAHAAGAEVLFLTGRIGRYRKVTLEQLARAGLDFVTSKNLRHKPRLGVRTIEFKARVLERLVMDDALAWYVTESRYEISNLQRIVSAAPFVLLDSRLEAGGPRVARGTPRLRATR